MLPHPSSSGEIQMYPGKANWGPLGPCQGSSAAQRGAPREGAAMSQKGDGGLEQEGEEGGRTGGI